MVHTTQASAIVYGKRRISSWDSMVNPTYVSKRDSMVNTKNFIDKWDSMVNIAWTIERKIGQWINTVACQFILTTEPQTQRQCQRCNRYKSDGPQAHENNSSVISKITERYLGPCSHWSPLTMSFGYPEIHWLLLCRFQRRGMPSLPRMRNWSWSTQFWSQLLQSR